MIDGKTVLGIIIARGGSKGLPRKNVLPIAGRPMIAWSITAAKDSRLLDRVVLSTDDPEIAVVAEEWGGDVPFQRPSELARDDTPASAVVLHVLDTLSEQYDYLVLLQATSPLRSGEDIDACIRRCREAGTPSCVSVNEASKSPYLMFRLDEHGRIHRLLDLAGSDDGRRQKLPPAYALNGAVYVVNVAWFRKTHRFYDDGQTVAYAMPAERSVDVDSELDGLLADLVGRRILSKAPEA